MLDPLSFYSVTKFPNSFLPVYCNSGIRNTVIPKSRNSDYLFTVFSDTVHNGMVRYLRYLYGIPLEILTLKFPYSNVWSTNEPGNFLISKEMYG